MGERPQKTMVVAKTLQGWDKAVDKLCASGVLSCKSQIAEPKEKKPPSTRPDGFSERSENQAVSPYTVTVTSTTTSVCNATDTVESLTNLMGPWGMRIWDLTSL